MTTKTDFGFKIESRLAPGDNFRAFIHRGLRPSGSFVKNRHLDEATGYRRAQRIPVEQRRPKVRYSSERNPLKRLLWRLQEDSQFQRQTLQLGFVVLCLWIGIEFYLFVQWGMLGGGSEFFSRPPGVEGFLPISALISLKYWLRTGIINEIHPSGLFIFIAIVAVSFVV